MSFTQLPQELLFQIFFMVEAQDICMLAQTCKTLHTMTNERSIWIQLAIQHQEIMPMSLTYAARLEHIVCVDTADLRRDVIQAIKTEQRWSRPRTQPILKHKSTSEAESIIFLEIFHDRWIVCVYVEGVVDIWDLGHPHAPRKDIILADTVTFQEELSWSCVVAARDNPEGNILLALTKIGGPTITRIVNLRIDETSEINVTHDLLAYISHPLPMFVRAVTARQALVLFSHGSEVEIYQWTTDTAGHVSTQVEDMDELWNGILGLHYHDGSFLCVKARSVELHTVPVLHHGHPWTSTQSQTTISSRSPPCQELSQSHETEGNLQCPTAVHLIHHFQTRSFRGHSLSGPITSENSTSYILLAYDVLQGLELYRIDIQMTHENAMLPMVLDVRLLGEHSLMAPQASGPGGIFVSSPTRSRNFVSTCCLGTRGARGLWIERARNSMTRSVTVFSTREVESSELARLEGHVIHRDASYDLREDLNHCAVNEITGLVVLGTRSGELRVLSLNRS